MADNVAFTPGSGATGATDEIGGVHYPRVKLALGADGTASDAPVGGGVESGALRVTIANDSTGVLSIDDNGSSITVDGTVTANLSATDNAVLDTIETNTDFGAVTGGGLEASALRVTLASDSTGVVSIDDNGGSLTVDGTVTANLSATDNAVLDSIQAALEGTLTVGTHAVTQSGTWTVELGSTDNNVLDNIDTAVSKEDILTDVTLTVPTGALDADDVAADTQVMSAVFRANDKGGWLNSLSIVDDDDQKVACTFLFFDANVSLGTENSAPSISDANAANFLGKVYIGTEDYVDIGGVAVATAQFDSFRVEPASGTDDLYIAMITHGAPTYAGGEILARIGIVRD